MNTLLIVAIYGSLAGVLGTAIGGLISAVLLFFGKKLRSRNMVGRINKNIVYSFLYEFSSGLMMAVVTFHMLPEAIYMGGTLCTLAGLFLGLLFVFLIQKFISGVKGMSGKKTLSTGILLLSGIALHNFPEGIAIGASFAGNISLALSLLIIITIHDIPEGVSVFVPLYASGMKIRKVLLLTALSGVPTGIGAIFGNIVGNIGSSFGAISMAFAAGAMLYICVAELSFEAKSLYNRKIITIGYILGLVLGILLK